MAQTFHRYRAGDKPVGGYRLIRKLGEGGFGEVWQASAPGGAEVALKFIDLTGQQGFREFKSLRLVKKITHNNLTPLHGFWLKNEDGTLIDESDVTWSQLAPVAVNDPSSSAALATAVFTHPVELIVAMGLGKKSLYDRLRECKDENLAGIPADELLEYMEDAARGIDYLNRPIHDMGHGPVPIVHSDVKPHNILIVGDGAQVCDFGLAHAVEALRKTCAAPLTLAYAAPESFRGKPSDKSDQYSLAITYVELRTGALPFDESLTGYEVMTAHVQGQLDFSRLLPGEESVIRRATSAMPQDRWRNCREMVIELRRALRLSTDSNFMPDAETIPDTLTRKSGPPFTHTMMPPGTAASETAPYSGLTPTDRDPALRTRTPQTLTPRVVSDAQQAGAAPRRKVSTRAKLLVSLLILAGIGGAAAYPYLNLPWIGKSAPSPDPGPGPAPPSNDDRVAYGQHIERNEFHEALARLKEPAFSAEEIVIRRKEVLDKWRLHAAYLFRENSYAKAAQDYMRLAEHFPDITEVNDLRLMQARALLNQLDVRNADAILKKVPAPEKRDTPRDRTYFRVKLLIEVKGEEQTNRLDELSAVWSERSPQSGGNADSASDVWDPTKNELSQLADARDKMIGGWLESAASRRNQQGLTDLQRILQIDAENIDAWLAKADAHLELGQMTQAMDAMEKRNKLTGAPNTIALRQRQRVLEAIYNLTSASSTSKAVADALAEVPTLLSQSQFADRRLALGAAVNKLAEKDAFLPQAVAALRPSADKMPELSGQFAELLKRDIKRRLEVERDFAGAAGQLLKDCEFVVGISKIGKAEVPEIVRACHAECLLELKIPGAADALGMSGSSAYYHYVKARVLVDGGGTPQQIKDSLKQLFAKPTPMFPAGSDRNAQAIQLVDQIADQVRPAAGNFKVVTLLTEPVVENAGTRETYEILKNAYRWASPPALSTQSQANLAVAARLKKSPDDLAIAQSVAKDVASAWLKDGALSLDDRPLAFALFHTFLLTHADSKDADIERMRLDAGRKLIELASGATLDAKDAAALYSVVLEPVEPLAKKLRNHEFFGDEARLIAKNAGLTWGFPSIDNRPVTVSDKLEDLYSEAIDASGRKIGEYFKARADLRAMRQPPDHIAILADVGELKNFPKYAGQALAMEGFVYFLQSRDEQGNVAKRYDKLQLALKSLVAAEKLAKDLPKDDLYQAYYIRSMIHTERGNLAALADAREKVVPAEEFKKAIAYAEKVIESGGGPNLQFAYEAAANAYEDLAWHARVEPEKNFAKAIEHLTNSVALNRTSPAAHMALARSYYKMIVEAGVNRKLSRQNLGIARRELEEAIKLAGDGTNAEAHLWLAKVIQATHVDEETSLESAQKLLNDTEYTDADKQFNKAYLAAEKAKFGDVFRVTYTYARAEHALFNPAIKAGSGGGLNSPTRIVHDRANQLAELKNGRTVRMDPVQEARILRVTADLLASADAKMPVKALENLDDAAVAVTKLPVDDLTRSDVKLIEFRLGLQAKLRPDQLASPAIVRSAMQDAIWYSTAPASFVWKDRTQALLTAMRLSQQMAIKSAPFVATAANDQAQALQRVINLKRPTNFDFKRHQDVVVTCIAPLTDAKSESTLLVHQKLRQVLRTYLDGVISEAKNLKRPAEEIAKLENYRSFVLP